MPLILQQDFAHQVKLGVWQISEPPSFFTDQMGECPSHLQGRRRLEYQASRMLLRTLLHTDLQLVKDEFGKPFLHGSDLQISLSHTQGLAAAIVGAPSVGIDVQIPVAKIYRIADKFLTRGEQELLSEPRLHGLHVYWGAKEVMYKMYGRRRVDFRKHLSVGKIDWEARTLTGHIAMPDLACPVDLQFLVNDEFILVFGWIDPTSDTRWQ